jgi:formiminotetrahydrofolate cyclodeaminase
MTSLGSRQVREALSALASRAEPPAAGVASALACAAAAALVELTAGLADERLSAEGGAEAARADRLRELSEQAGGLRERLLSAADEDAQAYAQVTKARDGAAQARALAQASEPPLTVAECAAEVAEAAAETARAGAWAFRADAVVAAELASAAAVGGAELVATNLAGDTDDPRTVRARAAADRARRASRAAANPSGD